MKKKLNRKALITLMATLPPCLVGMEACGSAHYWARRFRAMGHDVRLMAPQFVKPYIKSNKNDALDAQGICEAVQRPDMRFVPIKGIEQQDIQSIHRARSMAIEHRKSQVNQIRGLLAEYGITVATGISSLRKKLPEILEDAENELSPMMRDLLLELWEELRRQDERVAKFDAQIALICEQSETCQRLLKMPGIGPMIATAMVAAVADGSAFKRGRDMSAWIGLVPKQHSTGGKPRLLGISKRGDTYLRNLIIHGARSIQRFADKKTDRVSMWVKEVECRRGKNIATVALANKMVRIAWVIIAKGEEYRSAEMPMGAA